MQKKLVFAAILFMVLNAYAQDLPTRFELSKGTQTPTYFEIINWWKKVDALSTHIHMQEIGMSDAGYPLHLITISTTGSPTIKAARAAKKTVILINNGIHPGEPDGIDATMLLVKDIINKKISLPANVFLAIIPVYNIGGCLDRSANYRVDQNGPEEFGFRGNSQNLDLNRDFIKCDSKEARTFTRIFQMLDPDVFIDNHVSNGADYQHIMTLLSTQHSKLSGEMDGYMHNQFEPALYSSMQKKGFDLVPYVHVWGSVPDSGWNSFWDSPRYGSGYGALWHTFSFVPETHMLKSCAQRVGATKALMECFIDFASAHGIDIQHIRNTAKNESRSQAQFPIAWQLDKTTFDNITYKGFKAGYKPSNVSGYDRLFYDRTKPFEKIVPFYNTYLPIKKIIKPTAYIIPQGWWKVTELLQLNNVTMYHLKQDTTLELDVYTIENYKSSDRPYEGHHLNTNVAVRSSRKKITCRKGDWYIPMNQVANRFIIETLEPEAEDSYFVWNFFDPILGQKEGYSDYAFEDIAADYLLQKPAVQEMLKERIKADSTFAKNKNAQLNFVYQHSPWMEPQFMQYPIYRVP